MVTTPLTDDEAKALAAHIDELRAALERVVVGQRAAVVELITGLCADGHVLLEGVPGVAKTLLARTLSSCLRLRFARVQFTPDLMPADLLGTRIYNPGTREFDLHRGPVFCDVLLADEINRTPPKTQSALLEAMEERQVTIDGERHDLGNAFFVIATENPLEFEGTYPLPEAQTDRFLLKIVVGYPAEDAELSLYARAGQTIEPPAPVWSAEVLAQVRAGACRVRVDDAVRKYALALVRATRASPLLRLGASPRAGLMLLRAAQVTALVEGRSFVLPDDVKRVARPVLRHRLALSTDAELDGKTADAVLTSLLDALPVLASPA